MTLLQAILEYPDNSDLLANHGDACDEHGMTAHDLLILAPMRERGDQEEHDVRRRLDPRFREDDKEASPRGQAYVIVVIPELKTGSNCDLV
jgi:hypothetical protein